MGYSNQFLYFLAHPNQLRSIIQWKLWHQPVHRRSPENESSTTQECFKYLSMTSRSFSLVIKELHPELLLPVTLFYLILRGLDTIEDDMNISLEEKVPLLRNFQDFLEKENWNFEGNGPKEKDRELLVNFHVVIAEFIRVKPAYKAIIRNITYKMGNGMADYAINAEHNVNGVNSIRDYELYCHYVAGLVGEGLTELFVESGLANPALLQQPDLSESMGQFLQKTNIIRDVREDFDDKRKFWPKEIWSKHVEKFEDLFNPVHLPKALNCCSEMVIQSLSHVDDCLLYMAGIKDQSVFNFVAIPQVMAIATLELVFRNPKIFETNVKITKGDACQLMLESTQDLQSVCKIFKRYAQRIHKKNCPRDPNYMKISIACGNIEKYIESLFPTQNPQLLKLIYNNSSGEKKYFTEGSKEAFFLVITVLGALSILSAAMIALAYFISLRLDSTFGGPPKVSEAIQTVIVDQLSHSEL